MSFRYLNAAWELELPSHLKIVLLSLADQANDDGECWPSQSTIGRRCGTTTRQVSTNLRTLREMGLIEMVQRRRRKTAVYRLLIVDAKSTSDQESVDEDQDQKPTAPKTGSPTSQDQKPTSDKPSEEPSSDPSSSTRGHSVEVIERDGQTYEVGILESHTMMTEAIVDAMGWDRHDVTEPQWGSIHRAAKELRSRGVSPSEVPQRAFNYRMNHPEWSLTPASLVKWWADSARSKPNGRQVSDLAAAAERRQWRTR